MIYYIQDLHFYHQRQLEFDRRPFSQIEEMHSTIIRNWNKVVTDKDQVYVVGDISLKSSAELFSLIEQLNGEKYLAIGNHDEKIVKKINTMEQSEREKYFKDVQTHFFIKDGNQQVFISNFPHASWLLKKHGQLHVYGHLHGILEQSAAQYMVTQDKAFNSGCMLNDYTPQTLEGLKIKWKILKRQNGCSRAQSFVNTAEYKV